MVLPALGCVKGGANTMWTLVTLEKYDSTLNDVCIMGSYARNILQWNKNKTKSTEITQWRLLLKQSFVNPTIHPRVSFVFKCV